MSLVKMLGLGLAAALIYTGSMKWVSVCRETISHKKIKGQGLRILHITDLHSNSEKKMNVNIWRHIEVLDFDMMVITGDIIQHSIQELKPHIKYLQKCAQSTPVFYVDGNHDLFCHRELKELFDTFGIKSLYDTHTSLTIGENTIQIVGLRDYYEHSNKQFKHLYRIFEGLNPRLFTLVLTHQPQMADRIKFEEWDLLLAGHTHGGQVRLPFMPTLYAPAQGLFPKYGYGWYKLGPWDRKKMFVSKGIGATVFNVRFYNRPEIALIKIGAL